MHLSRISKINLIEMCAHAQRKDISLQQFFRHAARRSFSANSRKGFLALGEQVLSHSDGTALHSTSRLTIDSLNQTKAQRSSWEGRQRPNHEDIDARHAKDSPKKSKVPRPRFWGNPQVTKYGLEELRNSIAEMGLDTTSSPKFPKTEKEIQDAAALAELTTERKGLVQFWRRANELAVEVQHIKCTATREDVIKLFERLVPGKVPGQNCIVYKVERDFVARHNEVSFWCYRKKERMTMPEGKGIVGAVLAKRQSLLVTDIQKHANYYQPLDMWLGYPRESAIASPCFNEHKEVAFILEVTSTMARIHYTHFDRLLLEFAGTLLLPLIARSRLAEKYFEAIAVRERILDCATMLVDAAMIKTVNKFAHDCQLSVNAVASRVWMVDQKNDAMYVNTDDESKAEIQSISTGGMLGAAVHSRLTSKTFYEEKGYDNSTHASSFACVPILDRNDVVLGVLEMQQKTDPRTGLIEAFTEHDMKMLTAFAVLLANFIEHTKFVLSLRAMSSGMQHNVAVWEHENS